MAIEYCKVPVHVGGERKSVFDPTVSFTTDIFELKEDSILSIYYAFIAAPASLKSEKFAVEFSHSKEQNSFIEVDGYKVSELDKINLFVLKEWIAPYMRIKYTADVDGENTAVGFYLSVMKQIKNVR